MDEKQFEYLLKKNESFDLSDLFILSDPNKSYNVKKKHILRHDYNRA